MTAQKVICMYQRSHNAVGHTVKRKQRRYRKSADLVYLFKYIFKDGLITANKAFTLSYTITELYAVYLLKALTKPRS
jgi:hypothetical protein